MSVFPRVPFVDAEQHVDWARHELEILLARQRVERLVMVRVKRAAVLIAHRQETPAVARRELRDTLDRSFQRVARFGYLEARREILAQRETRVQGLAESDQPAEEQPDQSHATRDAILLALLARLSLIGPNMSPRRLLSRLRRRAARENGGRLERYAVSGVGEHARSVLGGWPGVVRVLGDRADEIARDVVSAMLGRRARIPVQAEPASVLADLLAEASRVVHNETLEVVGEALNLGRSAGVMTLEVPPRWAMRSEQLDRNTCLACDSLHGSVALVDSQQFYALMPPQGCRGGGRCRGILVFADDVLSLQVAAVAKRRDSA